MGRVFYGWWVVAACAVTFGLSVGIPYYSLPFFYDYFERSPADGGFGWSRPEMMLGFPLAALLTLWIGPLVTHRFSPRKLILAGTAVTAVALAGFGRTNGSLPAYYFCWLLFMAGYVFSGPIPHQVLIANWFERRRGAAMGIIYVGVGAFGAVSAQYVARPLTQVLGFRDALAVMGLMLFLAWPVVLLVTRDNPAQLGLEPDGRHDGARPTGVLAGPAPSLFRSRAFWLLLAASTCSVGAIGAVNQHMKLVFKDSGSQPQSVLDSSFGQALFLIMASSIGGRVLVGWLADRLSKKWLTFVIYSAVAVSIPLLIRVRPTGSPVLFPLVFGVAMGADYMLIPLVAAEQFGPRSLARVMGIILPVDMVGLTWLPYLVSTLRARHGDYGHAFSLVFLLAAAGAVLIALLPTAWRAAPSPPAAVRGCRK